MSSGRPQSLPHAVLPAVRMFTGVIIQPLACLAPELCLEGTRNRLGRSQLLPGFQCLKFPVLESCLLSLA